ncbi:MAG: response regulator [Rhodoferax sp.]|nr:response regulator [Rhodoferax sp.]
MSALRKVLVVDDDPVVGKSFNRVLSRDKGYVVVTAQNAAEALERIREQEYDVVFTDIKMPGMDGVELTERVKASRPWTPVVIITGYGTTANETRAKAVGVSDFMRKPLSPEMIEDGAAHALSQAVAPTAAPLSAPAPQAAPVEAAEKGNNFLKSVQLAVAPLIGLAYALALPLAGTVMLVWFGLQALFTQPAVKKALHHVKDVALFLAAPFIGLVYAVMLPFVGMAMLAWVGFQVFTAKPVVE